MIDSAMLPGIPETCHSDCQHESTFNYRSDAPAMASVVNRLASEVMTHTPKIPNPSPDPEQAPTIGPRRPSLAKLGCLANSTAAGVDSATTENALFAPALVAIHEGPSVPLVDIQFNTLTQRAKSSRNITDMLQLVFGKHSFKHKGIHPDLTFFSHQLHLAYDLDASNPQIAAMYMKFDPRVRQQITAIWKSGAILTPRGNT